ncbi:hypothetical protein LP420_16985 [Massilia sp. B-10]|nr:hypothetical protein LP420_16985 [Massilia sp. B-10]
MSAAARMAARRKAAVERSHHEHEHDHGPDTVSGMASATASGMASGTAEAANAPAQSGGMSDAERHMALQDFYTQTIKSTLGLRGMMLQLKVEKCAGLADFRAARDLPGSGAQGQGPRDGAQPVRALDQLLGDAPPG